MRIRRFELRAYGPFTGAELDFGPGPHGFTLVYGPNEAGKSTALRAIRRYFYGIPVRINEDIQRHPKQQLELAAELELGDGGRLLASRHKRKKNYLLDSGGEPIDDAWWNVNVLNRLDKSAFQRLFGIDHESLRDGRAALESGLGQALMAAAGGVAGLRNVMASLEEEAGELFKPRGRKLVIPELVGEIVALNKEVDRLAAKPAHYEELREHAAECERRKRRAEARQRELAAEESLLDRRKQARQRARERLEIRERLDAFENIPNLPAAFDSEYVQAAEGARHAESTSAKLQTRLEWLRAELDRLQPDRTILEAAPLVDGLAERRLVRAARQEEQEELEQERRDLEARRCAILQTLDRADTLEQSLAWTLPRARKDAVWGLVSERQAAEETLRQTQAAWREAEAEHRGLARRLEETPLASDVETLDRLELAVRAAAETPALCERLEEAAAEHARLARHVEAALRGLAPWRGDAATLEAVSFPLESTVSRTGEALHRAETRLDAARDEVHRLQTHLDERRREIHQIETEVSGVLKKSEADADSSSLPDATTLQTARALRDEGWGLLRDQWTGVSAAGNKDAIHRFLHHFPAHRTLEDAYAAAVRQADGVADAMFHHAERIARREQARREAQALETALADAERLRDEARSDRETAAAAWGELWRAVLEDPPSPAEMREWRSNAERAREQILALRDVEARRTRMQERADSLFKDLRETLSAYAAVQAGANPDAPERLEPSESPDALRRLRAHAEQVAAEGREQANRRVRLREQLAAVARQVHTAEERRVAAEARMATWREAWLAQVTPLGFTRESAEADDAPQRVTAFLGAMSEAASLAQRVTELGRRLEDIRTEQTVFAQETRRLAARVAPDLTPEDGEGMRAEDLARALAERLDRARKDETTREARRKELAEVRAEAAEAAAALETARNRLLILAKRMGVEPEQAPERLERIALKRELFSTLENLESELRGFAQGDPLETFANDALAHDPDELAARRAEVRRELALCEESRDRHQAELTTARNELEAMDGESRAALVREQAAQKASALQGHVERYVVLSLAGRLVAREIERYRKANQDPVLQSASQYFAAMTAGRYLRVDADYDENGDAVLAAVRREGETASRLGVSQLSDGTRDQLFLAMRCGGLERYLENNAPHPFIVDDILVHFDDARSKAALKALGQLASRTQVIFFTHHEHLVALAEAAAPTFLRVVRLE